MFTAALFTIPEGGNNHMSTNAWMDKQHTVFHTVKYYSAIKKKEVLICTITGTNFKNIMLSVRS